MASIKRCFVPSCKNNSSKNSNIKFVSIPRKKSTRKKWFASIGEENVLTGHDCYCCEDHFDWENDARNLLQWKLMPESTKLMLKTDVIPHKNLIPTTFTNDKIKQRKKQQEEAQGALHVIAEEETSGPSLNIKEEISIDESVLEDYLIPKLEKFENTNADTTDGVDPLSLSYMEIESRCTPKNATVVSSNIAETSHNKNESANFLNIIPKLETFENTSEDMIAVEENFIFSKVENQPVQETTILRSTLKDNTNFSASNSNISQSKKRILSDEDSRVEDRGFLSIVQVKSENREDYVDYAMYIAARLKNSNQCDNAIAIAKEKIELILCDLDKGVFQNLFAVPFSCNI